jgi:hypothetical protein
MLFLIANKIRKIKKRILEYSLTSRTIARNCSVNICKCLITTCFKLNLKHKIQNKNRTTQISSFVQAVFFRQHALWGPEKHCRWRQLSQCHQQQRGLPIHALVWLTLIYHSIWSFRVNSIVRSLLWLSALTCWCPTFQDTVSVSIIRVWWDEYSVRLQCLCSKLSCIPDLPARGTVFGRMKRRKRQVKKYNRRVGEGEKLLLKW